MKSMSEVPQEENNQLAEELAGYCRISVLKDGQLNVYLLPSKDKEYSTVDQRYNDSNDAFIEYTATYFPYGIIKGCSETNGGVKTYFSTVLYQYCDDGDYVERPLYPSQASI